MLPRNKHGKQAQAAVTSLTAMIVDQPLSPGERGLFFLRRVAACPWPLWRQRWRTAVFIDLLTREKG
jgi:hypothetical protein